VPSIVNSQNLFRTSGATAKQIDTERIMNDSEEKYRTIFESATDIILLLDSKGKINDVNNRLKDIGGWDREELIGKHIASLLNIISRKSLPVVMANYLKRMAGMTVSPYQVEMITRTGDRLTIEINATAMRKNGKVIGDLAILRDVTEHSKAEIKMNGQKQLIDRILASSPNAIIVVDKDHQIVLTNPAFYRLFDQTSGNAEGRKVEDVICLNELTELISKTLEGKATGQQVELKCKQSSFERILVANVINMEKDEILIILNDITETRERQAKLSVNERLVTIGEMASGVAHELNNPLTSVIGLSQLLLDQDVPKEVKEDLETIYSEARRAAAIVKNLLTFARKHASERQLTQINSIMEDVLKLRAYEHRVNNIQVNTQFDPQLPQVMADHFQLQQVFLNLILNAEYAMIQAHSQGTLSITTERITGNIKITCKDDGMGISPENMKRLFNPFFTTKEVGKGTGLGLSICFGIITSHNGRIYADSKLGQGATFVIELPVNEQQGG